MSWHLLERFLESEHFNNDPSLSVAYLAYVLIICAVIPCVVFAMFGDSHFLRRRYADHVGIQHVLCTKLRQFAYEEIEFFLPQLCHLVISLDNESMALEDFIIDLCEESVNGALLTFWLFQTYLQDLASNPHSFAFTTCRRIYNKVQGIVFGSSDKPKQQRIKENVLPVTVLSSIVLAAVATPWLPAHVGPLAIAQARRPRPADDVISDAGEAQKIPQRNHTVGSGSGRQKRNVSRQHGRGSHDSKDAEERKSRHRSLLTGLNDDKGLEASNTRPHASRAKSGHAPRPSMLDVQRAEARLSSSSLPDFRPQKKPTDLSQPPATAQPSPRQPSFRRRHSHGPRPLTPGAVPRSQQIRLLRSNYFRSEMAFLTALEDISNRLVAVPKPARLSALRAELALIAQDLPAEVDIPVICPAVLEDGVASRSKHHRIVRINPAEATSLNSAERVPYLLMLEVLREDFDFNPDSDSNQNLVAKLISEKPSKRYRIFDITDASREPVAETPVVAGPDSVFEPVNGDLGAASLLDDPEESDLVPSRRSKSPFNAVANVAIRNPPPRSSSGANTTISSRTAVSTPRTSDIDNSRGSSPHRRKTYTYGTRKASQTDPADVSELATHMRTAAQMLAQLETSGSKRPKAEVAAIRAKIIASMQTLEEQNFLAGDPNASSFENIIRNDSALAANAEEPDFEDGPDAELPDPGSSSGAGAARMENDRATGGVIRKGDREDPSAAMFGEEWSAKKERIRRSSPYGWMKNWDLVSVIVKTGADLRQEAFACQLILVCSKIWQDARTPVWIKNMRILVTGESSGLIETITNGVSLHSLKRSLTLASIAAGNNPKKRIATLKDHFIRAFGEEGTEAYDRGVDAFVRSLAAYSVISYVLQLKDRHNGNILIDNAGHMVHIDFGFMLSNSPGNMGFEAAPFKLTQEYIEVMGGMTGAAFDKFKQLCKEAFLALRKESERIVMLVELMGKDSKFPAYGLGVTGVVSQLRSRFVPGLSKEEVDTFVEDLVAKSAGSYYTRL